MAVPLPSVAGVEHRFVDVRGLRVHVATTGNGLPLVLQHGWPQHWYAWHRLIPLLADRFQVVCPDMRGFGWTAAPAGGYDKEGLADDLLAVCDRLRLRGGRDRRGPARESATRRVVAVRR